MGDYPPPLVHDISSLPKGKRIIPNVADHIVEPHAPRQYTNPLSLVGFDGNAYGSNDKRLQFTKPGPGKINPSLPENSIKNRNIGGFGTVDGLMKLVIGISLEKNLAHVVHYAT